MIILFLKNKSPLRAAENDHDDADLRLPRVPRIDLWCGGCVTMCLVGAWVDANEQLDLIDRTEWGGKQNHLPVVVSGFYLRFLQIGFDKVVRKT